MFAAALFSQGSASAASADVTWVGIALTSAPNAYLGDSAFTLFTNLDTVNGDTSQKRIGGISSRRGRQFELDEMQAGEGTMLFRNGDGYLDPTNLGSPYYPYVAPLKRVRAVRHQGGVRYPIFDGLIERLTPDYRVPRAADGSNIGWQDVEVGCVDGFEVLTNALLQSGFESLFLGRGAGMTFTAVESGESDLTITLSEPAANTLTTTISVVGRAITCNLKTDASNNTTETGTGLAAAIAADPIANKLIVLTGFSMGTTITALGATHIDGPHPMVTGSASWPVELTGARLNRVLTSIAWPAQTRNLDPGLYSIISDTFGLRTNPTNALTHMNDVATSELGYIFMSGDGTLTYHDGDHRSTSTRSLISQLTFTDDGTTGVKYQDLQGDYSRDHVVNSVTVTPGAGEAAVQTVSDPTATMTRSKAISTLLSTSASALAVATNIYDAYRTAIPRIQRLVTLDDGSVLWRNVLSLEIGDRVTVRSSPPGHLTSVAQDCYVEQIQHDIGVGLPHRVTLQLTQITASTSGGGSGGGTGGGTGGSGAMLDSSGDDFTLDDVAKGVLG